MSEWLKTISVSVGDTNSGINVTRKGFKLSPCVSLDFDLNPDYPNDLNLRIDVQI